MGEKMACSGGFRESAHVASQSASYVLLTVNSCPRDRSRNETGKVRDVETTSPGTRDECATRKEGAAANRREESYLKCFPRLVLGASGCNLGQLPRRRSSVGRATV